MSVTKTTELFHQDDVARATRILAVDSAGNPIPSGGVGDDVFVTNTDLSPVPVRVLNNLIPDAYDYISLGYTGDDVTGVVYKVGGVSGTVVATLALTYSSPGVLSSVARS